MAKHYDTYPDDAVVLLLKSLYEHHTLGTVNKHNCIMIHNCNVNTGGIQTRDIDEATGCPEYTMEVFRTFLKKRLDNLDNLDNSGGIDARIIKDPIEEDKLLSLQHQVKLNLPKRETLTQNLF